MSSICKLSVLALICLCFKASYINAETIDFGREHNIYYEDNSQILIPESGKKFLDLLSEFIIVNPNFGLMIAGHCNLTSNSEEDQKISRARVVNASMYLQDKGIDGSSIFFKSYGSEEMLFELNDPKAIMNNRVTIKVIFLEDDMKALRENEEFESPDDRSSLISRTKYDLAYSIPAGNVVSNQKMGEKISDRGEQRGHQKFQAHGEHGYSHHITLMGGATTSISRFSMANTFRTIGIDYEYLLPGHHYAIGAFSEFVETAHREYQFGAGLYCYPMGGLKFWVAPGVEFAVPHEDHHAYEPSDSHAIIMGDPIGESNSNEALDYEMYFLLRVGIGYDFRFGSFTISPLADMDFFGDQFYLVSGVALGWVF